MKEIIMPRINKLLKSMNDDALFETINILSGRLEENERFFIWLEMTKKRIQEKNGWSIVEAQEDKWIQGLKVERRKCER